MKLYRLLFVLLGATTLFGEAFFIYTPYMPSKRTIFITAASIYTAYKIYQITPIKLTKNIFAIAYAAMKNTTNFIHLPQKINTIHERANDLSDKFENLQESSTKTISEIINLKSIVSKISETSEAIRKEFTQRIDSLKNEFIKKIHELHSSVMGIKATTKEVVSGEIKGLEERLSKGFTEKYNTLDIGIQNIQESQDDLKKQIQTLISLLTNPVNPLYSLSERNDGILTGLFGSKN